MQAVFWSPDLKESIRSSIKQSGKNISALAPRENNKLAPQMAGKNGQEPGRPRLEYWN